MRTLLLLSFLLTVGCAKHVIRDANVYQAEVEFLSDAGVEVAELLLDEATSLPDDDASNRKCLTLAEPALVVLTRFPHHANMMLYLGGLGEDPGDAPEIPTAEEVCAVRDAAEDN